MLSLLNMKVKYDTNFPQKKIIEEVSGIFKKENFQLYLVGGAVRSLLMKQKPNDLDFTTNAHPSQVKSMFKTVILTGIDHGTVTVIWKKEPLEITTFRLEGNYLDQRRPSQVKYISSLKEDLSRRDFTINALAYDVEGYLFDYFQGREDIQKKIIKAIGDPFKRFSEDALRIMRACRFSGQLNFLIENNTLTAMKKISINLKKISVERIYNEFIKIINSSYPLKGLEYLKEINFFSLFDLPIINKKLKLWEKIEKTPPENTVERLFLFFHSFSTEESETFMNLIKFPNYFKKPILELKKLLNSPLFFSYINSDYDNRIFLKKLGRENIKRFLILLEFLEPNKEKIDITQKIINKNQKNPLNLKELKISGEDLLKIGLKDKEIGEGLKECLEIVLLEPTLNKKEILINKLLERGRI